MTCRKANRLSGKLYYSTPPNRFTYDGFHCRRTNGGYGLTCWKGRGDRLKKFVFESD